MVVETFDRKIILIYCKRLFLKTFLRGTAYQKKFYDRIPLTNRKKMDCMAYINEGFHYTSTAVFSRYCVSLTNDLRYHSGALIFTNNLCYYSAIFEYVSLTNNLRYHSI